MNTPRYSEQKDASDAHRDRPTLPEYSDSRILIQTDSEPDSESDSDSLAITGRDDGTSTDGGWDTDGFGAQGYPKAPSDMRSEGSYFNRPRLAGLMHSAVSTITGDDDGASTDGFDSDVGGLRTGRKYGNPLAPSRTATVPEGGGAGVPYWTWSLIARRVARVFLGLSVLVVIVLLLGKAF